MRENSKGRGFFCVDEREVVGRCSWGNEWSGIALN
jgi:hypothetical protein